MDPLSIMQDTKAGGTLEDVDGEHVLLDLHALKKLYGLLHVKANVVQRESIIESLDEKSILLLKKLLDEATEQAFQRLAKAMTGESSAASPSPDDSGRPKDLSEEPNLEALNSAADNAIPSPNENGKDHHIQEGSPSITHRSKSKKGQQGCPTCRKEKSKQQVSVEGNEILNEKQQKPTKRDSDSQGHSHSHKHHHHHHHKNLRISDRSSKTGQKMEFESKQAKESEKKQLRQRSIQQSSQSLHPRSMSSQALQVRTDDVSLEPTHELAYVKDKKPKKIGRMPEEEATAIPSMNDSSPAKVGKAPEKPELPAQMLTQQSAPTKETMTKHGGLTNEMPSQTKKGKGQPHQPSELDRMTMTLQVSELQTVKENKLPCQRTIRRKLSRKENQMDEPDQMPSSLDVGQMSRTVPLPLESETQVLTRKLETDIVKMPDPMVIKDDMGSHQKRDQRCQSGRPSETHQVLNHRTGKFSVQGSGLSSQNQMRPQKTVKSNKGSFQDIHQKLSPSSNTNKGDKNPTNKMQRRMSPTTTSSHPRRPSDQDQKLHKTRNSSPKGSQSVKKNQDESPYKKPPRAGQRNQIRNGNNGLKHKIRYVVSRQKKRLPRQKIPKEKRHSANSKLLQETSSTTESSSTSCTSLSYSIPSQQTSSDNSEDQLSDRTLSHHGEGRKSSPHLGALVSGRRAPPHRMLSHHVYPNYSAFPKAEHLRKPELKSGRLRGLKNKLALIFHHHHYHHRPDSDNTDKVGHGALPPVRHHRSFWNYLPRILHHTSKDDYGKVVEKDNRKRGAEVLPRYAVRSVPSHHQHGHLHAVIDGLLGHLLHSRKRDATAAAGRRQLQRVKTVNLLRVKKLHWWQRFHSGVKLGNKRKQRFMLGFRRSRPRTAKRN